MIVLEFNIFQKKFKNRRNLKHNDKYLENTGIWLGNLCIALFGFIGFVLKDKNLIDYTNLSTPNDYEKNDNMIEKIFQQLKRWKKYIALFETVNNFLLGGDKFVPKMHLRLPGFTYSACGKFTKSKERMRTFKKTADSRYIY